MKDQLPVKAADWNVSIDEVRETATSVLGFGVREGQRVVLKLIKNVADEMHSGAVLRAFRGEGAVRVYESETGAVLLERLDPGEELVDVVRRGADDEATTILAQVIATLANHEAPVESPTVARWARGFGRYLQSRDRQIPDDLVREAQLLYDDLTATQRKTMLLHGDLQHYNVLFDRERGWIAIDPKGVVGELEYEVGALMRNPVELPELFTSRNIIERRLEILTNLLHLNRTRVLMWSFAQAVLSAIWTFEDEHTVKPNNPALQLARALRPMLDS